MLRSAAYAALAVAAITSASADTNVDAKKATKGAMGKAEAVFLTPAEIKWGPAPADLPKGAELAVLYGDPTKKGTFAMRLRAPDGYKVPPHWHTRDEELTIIQGTLQLYMGDMMNGEPHDLITGSYHFLPGKQHHAAVAKGETIVQINGMGPFDIHYVNAEDNPNPNKTQKSARRTRPITR